MQVIWFHGTSADNAKSILKYGFRKGTWFSRHMEDAVEFGGPVVFSVRVSFSKIPMKWQVCCANALPATAIRSVQHIRTFKAKA